MASRPEDRRTRAVWFGAGWIWKSVAEALAQDLTAKVGRGFSERNIRQMRLFSRLAKSADSVCQIGRSGNSADAVCQIGLVAPVPATWSHYVRMLSVADPKVREYYEREALVGGWSVRQLDRQIATLAFQRTRVPRSRSIKEETRPLTRTQEIRSYLNS